MAAASAQGRGWGVPCQVRKGAATAEARAAAGSARQIRPVHPSASQVPSLMERAAPLTQLHAKQGLAPQLLLCGRGVLHVSSATQRAPQLVRHVHRHPASQRSALQGSAWQGTGWGTRGRAGVPLAQQPSSAPESQQAHRPLMRHARCAQPPQPLRARRACSPNRVACTDASSRRLRRARSAGMAARVQLNSWRNSCGSREGREGGRVARTGRGGARGGAVRSGAR